MESIISIQSTTTTNIPPPVHWIVHPSVFRVDIEIAVIVVDDDHLQLQLQNSSNRCTVVVCTRLLVCFSSALSCLLACFPYPVATTTSISFTSRKWNLLLFLLLWTVLSLLFWLLLHMTIILHDHHPTQITIIIIIILLFYEQSWNNAFHFIDIDIDIDFNFVVDRVWSSSLLSSSLVLALGIFFVFVFVLFGLLHLNLDLDLHWCRSNWDNVRKHQDTTSSSSSPMSLLSVFFAAVVVVVYTAVNTTAPSSSPPSDVSWPWHPLSPVHYFEPTSDLVGPGEIQGISLPLPKKIDRPGLALPCLATSNPRCAHPPPWITFTSIGRFRVAVAARFRSHPRAQSIERGTQLVYNK